MNKLLVNLVCLFIPQKKNRRHFRSKYQLKPEYNNTFFEMLFKKSINNIVKCRFDNIETLLKQIAKAIIDVNGNGALTLMLNNASVPSKYRYMFYEMKEGDIFIDGGMNEGIVTDIALKIGAKVYGFEPNPFAVKFLKNKYRHNENVVVEDKAISNKDGLCNFQFYSIFDQGGNMVNFGDKNNLIEVKTVNFSKYLENLQCDIYMVKIDIEGAEFDVIENMIESGIYKKIKYIVCETHEIFFTDGDEKMKKLEKMINDKNIANIYLDWI